MNTFLLAVAVAAFVVYVAFNAAYLIELRRTSGAVRKFIAKAENGLDPALEEFRATIGLVRKIADDAGSTVENIRRLMDAVGVLENGLKQFYEYSTHDLVPAAGAKIAGLKAGIKTGVVTLVKTLKERKEGSP